MKNNQSGLLEEDKGNWLKSNCRKWSSLIETDKINSVNSEGSEKYALDKY